MLFYSVFFNAPELKATEVPFCNMTAKVLFWCFQSTWGRVFLWLAVSFDLLYFCVYHPSAFPYYAEGVVAVLSHQAGLGGRYVTIPSSLCNDCLSAGVGIFKIALTLFGSGFKPSGASKWPKYGTSCFLNCNYFGLSLMFFSRQRSRRVIKFLSWSWTALSEVSPSPMLPCLRYHWDSGDFRDFDADTLWARSLHQMEGGASESGRKACWRL